VLINKYKKLFKEYNQKNGNLFNIINYLVNGEIKLVNFFQLMEYLFEY